ncbi:serine/threonine-protein kinase [Prosthecobacter vanneervenii]|uniref:Serine/threonine protein kinase n=1 Tax=Prosthecobacter vanneervenii TaxID=48466 RepID=A0A7W8DK70_9BACT|nr:serine/threonine-protein kinase [Prosthecobacter vanneervenii]MBB5032750.1 serine/threonine protein kinase [Prosthecobacter vanneervenii]
MSDASHAFSDTAAAALLDDGIAPLEAGDEKVGDELGPYRLLEKLGEGGFGIVWRAEQSHPVKREVAIKLLKRGMDSRQVLARFEQERRMLAAMEHPCITTILDAGMSPDGRPYFVMELLRGRPITAFCEEHHLALKDRIRLFREVCSGVQHAHQKGVIHRDLKPSNILVTEVDGRPMPKIIDFGIAKALASGDIQGMTFATQANFVLGTPQYMSPEQIEDVGSVDTRSDIYALGTVLYEMLTGSPPFAAITQQCQTRQDFWRIVREKQPPRPSTSLVTGAATRTVAAPAPGTTVERRMDVSQLPADLDWIALRALEKEPQRRYQSAAEFAADLQCFLDGAPVSAHPPSRRYIASRWIRRHRVAFAAACVSVLALVTGAGVAIWQARLARAAQASAESASLRSSETAAFLSSLLTEVAAEVRNGRNPEALRLALITSQKNIEDMRQSPDLQIELMGKVARLFDLIGDRRLSVGALQRHAELIAARLGADHPTAREAAYQHLLMMVDHGSRIEAVNLLKQQRAHIEAHEGKGTPAWFRIQSLLVRDWVKLRRGSEASAEAATAAAEARRQQLPGPELHAVLMSYAGALESAKKYALALQQIDECKTLARQRGDFEEYRWEFDVRTVEILVSSGDYARAIEVQSGAIERMRQQLPSDQVAHQILWLAEIENRARMHQQAIAHAEEILTRIRAHNQAIANDEARADTQREEMLKAFEIQTTAWRGLKQPANAIASAEEGLRIAQQGGNENTQCHAMQSLAAAHEFAGHLEDAWQLHRQIYEKHAAHNASYKNRLDDLRAMAQIRQRQGRLSDALAHARDAWQQTLAEPSSKLEPDYLEYMADFALKIWKAVKAKEPMAAEPEELGAWEAAAKVKG